MFALELVDVAFNNNHSITKDQAQETTHFLWFLELVTLMYQHFGEGFWFRQEDLVDVEQTGETNYAIVGDGVREVEVRLACWSSELGTEVRNERDDTLLLSVGTFDCVGVVILGDVITYLWLGKMSQWTQEVGIYNTIEREPDKKVHSRYPDK
jgi:hypothetical protein